MRQALSIYFPAGDFVEAARRFRAGEPQTYATHDEVIRTCIAIADRGLPVDMYSFMTPAARETAIAEHVRVIDVGGAHFRDPAIVTRFRDDPNDRVIVHYPGIGLLRAAIRSDKAVFAVIAASSNNPGPRAALGRFRLRLLLNNDRIDFVANHCFPATEHLRAIGVAADKLLPWNIPLARRPKDQPIKDRSGGGDFELCYVGSVNEAKGVGDLVRALALVAQDHGAVRCSVAGGGDVDVMRALAESLGIASRVTFLGLIGNDEAFALMRRADAVVVPSRHSFSEGFPLALFEAIASRTPIICSDHPMFRAVFADRRNTMVFPAGDAARLASSIAALAADPALYRHLSAAADDSWAALEGAADWSTMIQAWAFEGKDAGYLKRNTLAATRGA